MSAASPRPLVAVTGPDSWLPLAWWFIAWAVWRSGGRPVRLTPERGMLRSAPDAVIISGGSDIDPGLYRTDIPDFVPADPARDRFEIQMIEQALQEDIPLLGICRGAQLLNVVLGGRLHADLRPLRRITSNRRTPFPAKTVAVAEDSGLRSILGTAQVRVNSLHHQAISDLGRGLHVVGRDLDDIVQAVEDPQHRFRVGVQWHPEYLPQKAAQRRLFAALVAAIPQS